MLYFRMPFLQRFVTRLGPGKLALPVFYMGLITFLSHLPGSGKAGALLFFGFEVHVYFGNLLHVPLYWGLALCWHVALENASMPTSRRMLFVIALAAAFGVLDELHQTLVPGRTASWVDLLSDTFGALLATLSWRFLRPLFFACPVNPHHSQPPTTTP